MLARGICTVNRLDSETFVSVQLWYNLLLPGYVEQKLGVAGGTSQHNRAARHTTMQPCQRRYQKVKLLVLCRIFRGFQLNYPKKKLVEHFFWKTSSLIRLQKIGYRLAHVLFFLSFVAKIQQTKMLVTCQRFGDLFLFGLIWQYSSNHKTYNKGRFNVIATYLQQ